jgi:hypothetical protein
MTVILCDRCGKELPGMSHLYIVEGYPWDRQNNRKRMELCEWCFKCWLDWPKEEANGTDT